MASRWHRSWCLALAILYACAPSDAVERRGLLATEQARRLVGAWDVTLVTDTTAMVFRTPHQVREVYGTIVLTLNRGGSFATPALGAITHEGSYDIDFAPAGFTTGPTDGPPLSIAHLARRLTGGKAQGEDSLTIVLSPGSDRFPVRMYGIFTGDSVAGYWIAESHSVGGGQGSFMMRRHSQR